MAVADSARPATVRVLLAESDELIASILRHRLEREGWSVELAPDGESAKAALPASRFALVVLDLKLAGTNGFELLRQIRQEPGAQSPVILLSSSTNEQDLVRGFELGADDYLFKPFSPIEFVARARRLLKGAGGRS